jgi:Tfp pilus assembly protein PilX
MRNHVRRRKGTVIAMFLVLVAVLTTSLISTMALTSGTGTQVASLTFQRDQAFYAAEAGIQHAFWKLEANNSWRASSSAPLTGTVANGATYSVTVVGDWNSPVLITSRGAAGSTASITVTAAASPSTIVPAITLGNNFDNSGNVTIHGDVKARGNISTSGKLTDNGSLFAHGTIDASGSVDISGQTVSNSPDFSLPVIDMGALKAMAQANGSVIQVPNGSNAYEVTSLNLGQGGVVYFAGGPIKFKGNVTITGYGTVVSEGGIEIRSAASFGSSNSPATANIVTAGSLSVNGYLGLVGSIYASGTITKNGGLDVTGVIVGQMDLDTSGGMTITRAQPPAFDARSAPSGTGTMVLTRITGPIF